MPAWLIWLIAAGLLSGAELLTLDLVLLMFGGAALATAGVALLGFPVPAQLIAFIVVSLGLLVLVRPVAARHLRDRSPDQIDGAQVFVGRLGVVSQPVDEHGGRIKIGGDEWSAVAQTPPDRFEVGSTVRVMAIRGATAVVSGDMV
ncbi:MAG: NfeD family protein [Geodermatophilaceae bacterium]|nr:NfeD family protein [Geodermatophilaceae bacterium]MDQ3454450.1 NfeD family protein [Actinomycetota bacterium]